MVDVIPYPWRDLGDFISIGSQWLSQNNSDENHNVMQDERPGVIKIHRTCSDDMSADEAIHIQGNCVVHSIGQRVVRVYSMPNPVLQVIWCSFQEDSKTKKSISGSREVESTFQTSSGGSSMYGGHSSLPTVNEFSSRQSSTNVAPAICLLMETELAIRGADGAEYSVALPFRACCMWDAGGFLLLQAKESSIGSSIQSSAPSIFSLFHPLNEPRPVSCSSNLAIDAEERLLSHRLTIKLLCCGRENCFTKKHRDAHAQAPTAPT